MPPSKAVVLGSDAEVADAGGGILRRGNAVDAVVASVFSAAGLYPSVLFGPVQLLIGGAGAGLRAVDGRTRQPGLGNPRPRGLLPSQPVPPAARVAVPALPAALLAAVATYGRLPVAAVLAPGIEIARARSRPRAELLVRIAQRGPAALAGPGVADELIAAAGRVAGGILSQRDLAELRPDVTGAVVHAADGGRDVMTVPWGAAAVREAGAPSLQGAETRVVVAVDRNGLVAVACYEVTGEGLPIDAFDVVAPFTAAPVLRGERRVKPGAARPCAAPIALGQLSGVVNLAAGVGASVDAEAGLGAWLATYRPVSELEREAPVPRGLAAVQRAGIGVGVGLGPVRLTPGAPVSTVSPETPSQPSLTPWRFAYSRTPILSIVRMSRVVRLRLMKRENSGTQTRRLCTLTFCQRLVLMLECETFCARSLRLPVISLFAMMTGAP